MDDSSTTILLLIKNLHILQKLQILVYRMIFSYHSIAHYDFGWFSATILLLIIIYGYSQKIKVLDYIL
jgi:ABC-type phosphate transport system permease subunit